MEKKQSIKVSLSTAILAIIVVALIGGIVYFVTQNNELKHKETQSQSEKQTLEGKIGELQNTINQISSIARNTETAKEDTKTTNTNTGEESSKETKNSGEYKEITSELSADQIFYVKDFEKKDGNYVLKGSIYEAPYIITADELKTYIKKGKMTLNTPFSDEEYIIRKPNDEESEYGSGSAYVAYVLCDKKYTEVANHLIIHLSPNKYYIISMAEYSDKYRLIDEKRTITVSENTKCTYSPDSNDEKTDTVGNVFSKKLYFGGCFNFTFKDGKCTSVNEVVIGH